MEERNIILTKEIKEKLKGCLGFQVDVAFTYVPEAFRNKKNKIPKELCPVFSLKSKDGLELAQLEDDTGDMTRDIAKGTITMTPTSGKHRIRTLEYGVIEIKNYYLETGEIISYKDNILYLNGKQLAEDSFIKYLPIEMQLELQNAINERSELTPEELEGLGL